MSCPARLARAISSPDVFCCALRALSSSGIEPAARGFERRDLLERLVGIEAAVAEAGADLLDVIANVGGSSMLPQRTIVYSYVTPSSLPMLVHHRPQSRLPAAGLGTRFLPATKAQPKEMLPLVDKPIIQYGVEEAVASRHRQHHPGHRPRQERDRGSLRRVGRSSSRFSRRAASASSSRRSARSRTLINFAYVRQGEPLGLGHAVLVTRELVGDEPFAVILGDDVIDADPPAIEAADRRLRAARRPGARGRARAARGHLELRRDRDRGRTRALGDGVYQVRDLVEKPPKEEAPSDLAIIGRYVLTPDIFPALADNEERSHR